MRFHLAGINNQNFLLQDEQTSTVWQQVSGKAVYGKLRGQQLRPVFWDEITFAEFKNENPAGRILKPNPEILKAGLYAKANWEDEIAKLPLVTKADGVLPQRTVVLGIQVNGIAKAYPLSPLSPDKPIVDRIGQTPIILWVAADRKSIRCFDRTVDGKVLDLYAKPGTANTLVDTNGTEWDFTGASRSGLHLKKISVLKDYWFDWKNYHPDTRLYRHS